MALTLFIKYSFGIIKSSRSTRLEKNVSKEVISLILSQCTFQKSIDKGDVIVTSENASQSKVYINEGRNLTNNDLSKTNSQCNILNAEGNGLTSSKESQFAEPETFI